MSVKYRIGYYQVNIGVGDCEIVLLIKETSSATPSTEEILKAVLIDGGELSKGDTYRLRNINAVLESIETEFNLKPKELKFDAVVITHWDTDHYLGVLEMMFYDMQLQEGGTVPTRRTRKGPDPGGPLLQVSFLKYDPSGNPLSTLYMPNKRTQADYDVHYSTTGEFGFWAKRFKRVCKVILDRDKPISDAAFCRGLKSSLNDTPPSPLLPPTADNKIVGRELFSGDYIDAARTAGNPAKLIDAYEKSGKDYKGDTPGLFCIMANNRCLPPAKSLSEIVKSKLTSVTNRSSIGCVIIRPNGSVSHYFAGDMDADQEARMIDWTGLDRTTGSSRPRVEDTVQIVKGSHHGAAESFPLHLCQVFKPSVMLFSAGDNVINKHPSWNRLFYVHAYLVNSAGAHAAFDVDGITTKTPVYLTAFPDYLYRLPSNGFVSGATEYLEAGGSNGVAYREAYESLFPTPLDPTNSLNMVELFKLFKLSTPTPPDLDAESVWIGDQLFNLILPRITSIKDSAYPSEDMQLDVKSTGITATTYVVNSMVSSIQVTSDDTGPTVDVNYWGTNLTASASRKRAAPYPPPPSAPSKVPTKRPPTPPECEVSAEGSGDDDGDIFYIMSSLVAAQDPSRSAYVADQWDAFVSTLFSGFITTHNALSSSDSLVELDGSDEWLAWFKAALSPTSVDTDVQIFVSAVLDGSKANIQHFEFVIPLPLASKQQVSLKFGPSYVVGQDPSTAFDPAKHFLRFDMSEDTSSEITLKDLLSFSNFPADEIGFGSELAFTLVKSKSVVWFSPVAGNYSAAFRLEAVASPGDWTSTLDSLGGFNLWRSGVMPTTISVIVKSETTKLKSWDALRCEKAPQLGFLLEFTDFTVALFCGPKAYVFALSWKTGAIAAVRRLLEMDALNSPGLFKVFEHILGTIAQAFDILQVSVEFARKGSGFKIAKLSVTAQLTLKTEYGKSSSGGKNVAFLLSFTWPQKTFVGRLYNPDFQDRSWQKLMPYYEEHFEVVPTIDPSPDLSILDLIPGISVTPPKGVPTVISRAMLMAHDTSISFSGALRPYQPDPEEVPPISFDKLDLATSYNWKSNLFSFSISALVNLRPDAESSYTGAPGFLSASLSYEAGCWQLIGQALELNFGDLVTFFHKTEQSQVKDMLGHITIHSMLLNYEYDGTGKPSKFLFTGSIQIAMFGLKLKYSRDATGWDIKAALDVSEECKLGDVIASICGGDEEVSQLPDFISDILLNIPQSNDPGAWENSPLYLSCSKLTPALGPKQGASTPLVFALRITLGKLRFTFIQISYPKSPDVPARKPKRVLMFSFTKILPSLTIPVVGKVENPIDGLQFLWVQDANASSGLTREEIEEINTAAFPGGNELYFKETKKVTGPSDVVIGAGCHFILLVNSGGTVEAGIDYKFATKKKPPPGKMKEEEVPPGGVSKASVHKKVGPLSIANIGLQFKGGKLFIILDATVALGPIAVSLMGFGVGVKLTANFFTHFEISNFGLELRGLGAALDKPPLLLAGVFEDLSAKGSELYGGGVAISVKQYSFLAVGSYGVITDGSGKTYKTFFVFAQLHGPLVELEFATLNGVKLGFGYNSHLRYPNVEEIFTFPLVKGLSSGTASKVSDSSNVLTVLADAVFNTWVTPQEGSLWFAAGFDVLAFETLDLRAVAVIEIDPYVSIGLFADAICSLPPNQPREQCFAYTELGIACQIDFKTGTFSIARQLSPNSFVLHPSCHLRGGFALYYWFDPSPYAGQFVFTIGGYHPSFNVPSYYPQSPRLSISWQLDTMISITGEAYFAVTPKCCMGGGMLSTKYNFKLIEAHFNAHADFLMAWNPFHFIADVGVTVGVTLHAKLGPLGGDLTADAGADLHLEGPPLGGKVHIKVLFASFDIYFGRHPPPPPPLTLNEFWDLLSRSTNQQNATRDVGVALVVESGYVPDQNKDVTPEPGTPWIVLAGQFKFSIQCRFAVTSVQFEDEDGTHKVLQGKDVYAKPMHLTSPASSELSMSVRKRETSKLVERFTFGKILKNVPSAQWGKYVQGEDPVVNRRPSALLNGSNSTINDTLMGARVVAPEPEYPDDHIPPYDVNDWMFVDVIEGARLPVEKPSGEAQSWLPKKTTWKGAEKAWMSPPTKPQSTVDAWAKAFGWKDKLVGAAPAILLKNFSRVYLDIPSLTLK